MFSRFGFWLSTIELTFELWVGFGVLFIAIGSSRTDTWREETGAGSPEIGSAKGDVRQSSCPGSLVSRVMTLHTYVGTYVP